LNVDVHALPNAKLAQLLGGCLGEADYTSLQTKSD
jgi:hypothetical protein